MPERLTSLFDYEAVNLGKALLKEHSLKLFTQYEEAYNQRCCDRLIELSKTQGLSEMRNVHRAGRITASNFHSVIHTRNSISPFNKLMQYETPPSNLPNLKYGRETEEIARESYYALVGPYHSNIAITKTGLHISANYPHLGASPDRITDCDCCRKGLVEIKCPRKYSTGLKGWENKNFANDSTKNVKKDHPYFAQMQGQMFLLGLRFCDFFVWTPVENDYLLVRIEKDEHFISKALPELDDYFFAVLLPEVVSRKNDLSSDNKQKHYCICQRPCFEPMIACDKLGCEVEWYRYVCMSITRAPKGSWIFPKCKGYSIN